MELKQSNYCCCSLRSRGVIAGYVDLVIACYVLFFLIDARQYNSIIFLMPCRLLIKHMLEENHSKRLPISAVMLLLVTLSWFYGIYSVSESLVSVCFVKINGKFLQLGKSNLNLLWFFSENSPNFIPDRVKRATCFQVWFYGCALFPYTRCSVWLAYRWHS